VAIGPAVVGTGTRHLPPPQTHAPVTNPRRSRRLRYWDTFVHAYSTQHFYRAMLCIRGTSHGPVSVSVTSRSSTKTAKRRITQTTPHDSPGTLVFWIQRSPRNSTGVPPTGALNAGGVGQTQRLSTNNRLYLENGKDRHKLVISIMITPNCETVFQFLNSISAVPVYIHAYKFM